MKISDLSFVGTRTTAKRNAFGRGIEVFDASAEPWVPIAVFPATNPSFLALDRRRSVLHAVHGDGSTFSSYAIRCGDDTGTGRILERIAEQCTEGTNPAHIVVDPTGNWLIVTNHSSGTVSSFRITDRGDTSAAVHVLAFAGEPGPFASDQTGSKPHQVVFFEDTTASRVGADGGPDTATFLVPDKGLDTVFRCTLNLRDGSMSVVDELRLRQGCGPRHLVIHARSDVAYVLGELANTVTVLTGVEPTGTKEMKAVQILPTLPEDDVRDSRGGEIVLDDENQVLWATNRSGAGDATSGGPEHDTAVSWRIEADGRLTPREYSEVGGVRPRFAAVDPRKPGLDVALERSHRIVRLGEGPAVASENGPAGPSLLAEVKSPVCIVFGAE